MVTNGLNPSHASPAAKVTACCSAIPTSKNLSGCSFENSFSPVPSGIAAVIATIFLSFLACIVNSLANIFVYDAIFELDLFCLPVGMSNLLTPWNLSDEFSAGW